MRSPNAGILSTRLNRPFLMFGILKNTPKQISLGAATGLAGGLGLVGGLAANQANERIAQDNRRFQRQMSNTAYRRAVTDMKAAGLNPMLAGINSTPASTPGGSTANMRNALNTGVSSAIAGGMAKQNLENLKTTEQNVSMDTKGKEEDVLVKRHTARLRAQEIRESRQRTAESATREQGQQFTNVKLGTEAALYAMGGPALRAFEKAWPGLLNSGALGVATKGINRITGRRKGAGKNRAPIKPRYPELSTK